MSLGDFFSGIGDKISGLFGGGSSNTASNIPPVPARKPVITQSAPAPIPGVKPTMTTSTVPSSGGFSLGTFGDFLEKVGGVVEKGVNTFYGAKSQIEQLKTAQELEKIKYEAVTASAKQAPAPAQIVLPTFQDWLNNPREAASMVTPAALAGSGAVQTGLSGAVYIIGGALAIWFLAKKV